MSEREQVISKQFLPAEDDPRWQQWQKKRLVVRMMPLKGPVTIVTVDAPTKLPPEWVGWLAVDLAGHPYPLHSDVQSAAYDPVQPTVPDQTRTPDLEAVTRMVADKIALARVMFDGTGRPPFVEFGFSDAEDIRTALMRAERVEAAARRMGTAWANFTEADFARSVQEMDAAADELGAIVFNRAALAPAPGEEGK